MAKLWDKVDEKFDSLFEEDFASEGIKVTGKAKNFEGTVEYKDGKQNLEAKFEHKMKLHGFDVNAETTVNTNNEHELEVNWKLDKNELKKVIHTHKWDSSTHGHDHTVSLVSKPKKGVKSRFDLHFDKDKNWDWTNQTSTKVCKKTSLLFKFHWDSQAKALTETHWGLLMKPADWGSLLVSWNTDGPWNKVANWRKFGAIDYKWRSKSLQNKTKIGVDYRYNLSDRSAGMKFGIFTEPTKGLELRGKVDSCGNVEAAAKLEIADKWDLIVGTASTDKDIVGEGNASIGIALEGKLK